MRDTRGDEKSLVLCAVEVHRQCRAFGRRVQTQVVKHDAGPAAQHVPVVRLVQVVVQADDRPFLLVRPVRLDHLAPLREPRPSVGLYEPAPFVAVHVRGHDHDVCDLPRQVYARASDQDSKRPKPPR